MEAFHTNWTKPYRMKYGEHYQLEDFEILTTLLSVLKWQQINGDMRMITDEVGYTYYKKLGIEKVWNLGIEVYLDEEISTRLDPQNFWAAGKIYALRKQKSPCVMIDTDFIVWEPLTNLFLSEQIIAIHQEEIDRKIYPNEDYFHRRGDEMISNEWDWSVKPYNTAWLYIGDSDFKEFYTETSITFMESAKGKDYLTYMVFAEQRLLAMCAKKMHKNIMPLYHLEELFQNKQKTFTHIWGYKSYLRTNQEARKQFCRRCVKRILLDFPDMRDVLIQIEEISPYIKDINMI